MVCIVKVRRVLVWHQIVLSLFIFIHLFNHSLIHSIIILSCNDSANAELYKTAEEFDKDKDERGCGKIWVNICFV